MHLILEPCLTMSRNAGMLCRQHPRVQQRLNHFLGQMTEELMRHAQECDVSDFSGHSVRSLPNRNWFHVIRFYSLFDQVFRHS